MTGCCYEASAAAASGCATAADHCPARASGRGRARAVVAAKVVPMAAARGSALAAGALGGPALLDLGTLLAHVEG